MAVNSPPCAASDFTYELPEELIAQQPLAETIGEPPADARRRHRRARRPADARACRSSWRPAICWSSTTRSVIPARLFALKESGGKVELLLERPLDGRNVRWCMRARASRCGRPCCCRAAAASIRIRREARRPLGGRTTGSRARVLRALRPDAAAALHPARTRRRRQHALPERVRAQARRGRRAHRQPALRRARCSPRSTRAACSARSSRCTWAPARSSRCAPTRSART